VVSINGVFLVKATPGPAWHYQRRDYQHRSYSSVGIMKKRGPVMARARTDLEVRMMVAHCMAIMYIVKGA
jgi:hypothetical protein